MGDNGTYTYKEESEPLGQRIEPVDPSPGYPTEYSEITDIASQPEWNCTLLKDLPGGFFNMPVECQKKEAEMMDFSIEGMLYDIDQANLERATEAKFGKDIGKIRKSDEIKKELGYVLRATAKRSGGGEQRAVIESNIPDACAWDNGNPDCEVNVPSGDIPGFVDASQDGARPLNGDEIESFQSARTRALDVLKNNERCRNAIVKILKNVGGTAFLPDVTVYGRDGSSFSVTPIASFIFDSTTGKSGYLDAYDGVTMTASGSSGENGTSIVYGVTDRGTDPYTGILMSAPIKWNEEFFSRDPKHKDRQTLSVLHEIIHQWATDIDIANYLLHPKTPYTNMGEASEAWNQILGVRCGLLTNQRSSPGETVIR